MKLLKAIGALFARIWRWIKETAWIQPLLIVGAIFALIFAIPYFTSWVKSLGVGDSNYYSAHKQTLEGEASGSTSWEDATTKADLITNSIYKNSNFSKNAEDMTATADKLDYGYKYFLVYVSEDCENCDALQDAFENLEDYWNNMYIPVTSHYDGAVVNTPFQIYTIFTDETSSNDDDTDKRDYNPFRRYLQIHQEFFEESGARFMDATPYVFNSNLTEDSNYKAYAEANETDFCTPTVVLVDYTDEAADLTFSATSITGRVGASEVLFGVNGDTKFEKANVLMNMWNHTDSDPTTSIHNPFCANYQK